MATNAMRILEAPDPRLLQVSEHVTRLDIGDVIQMFALMNHHNAYGLAAPQVGINKRFFCTHWGELFVNPSFIARMADGKTNAPEACLSLPGKTYMVERWNTIQVDGKFYTGLHARIIQHEMEHLDGLLISAVGVLPQDYETAKKGQPDSVLLARDGRGGPTPNDGASS